MINQPSVATWLRRHWEPITLGTLIGLVITWFVAPEESLVSWGVASISGGILILGLITGVGREGGLTFPHSVGFVILFCGFGAFMFEFIWGGVPGYVRTSARVISVLFVLVITYTVYVSLLKQFIDVMAGEGLPGGPRSGLP